MDKPKRANPKKCKKCKKCKGNIVNKEGTTSVYEKDLMFEIEAFRLARSNWLASTKGKTITNISSDEILNKSEFYKNRHFKTVRPLPYFTLRNKISESEAFRSKITEEEKLDRGRENEFEEFLKEDFDPEKKKVEILDEKEKVGESKIIKSKGKEKKKKGPSKKAIENLKEAKRADKLVESIKCNDGKEVTVVIKGFCLCDKDNLRKFKLNKIRHDYEELDKLKPESEKEEITPHLADSLEVHKKRSVRKSVRDNEDEEFDIPSVKLEPGKHVSFGTRNETGKENIKERLSRKEEMGKESKKSEEDEKKKKEESLAKEMRRKNERTVEEDSMASIVTLFKNTTPKRSEIALTEEQAKVLKQLKT